MNTFPTIMLRFALLRLHMYEVRVAFYDDTLVVMNLVLELSIQLNLSIYNSLNHSLISSSLFLTHVFLQLRIVAHFYNLTNLYSSLKFAPHFHPLLLSSRWPSNFGIVSTFVSEYRHLQNLQDFSRQVFQIWFRFSYPKIETIKKKKIYITFLSNICTNWKDLWPTRFMLAHSQVAPIFRINL